MKKLGLGFMRLPLKNPSDDGSVDLNKVNEMVDYFLERGFTYFDTAWMYHDYKSEIFIKEALVKRHPRESFVLADKLPTYNLISYDEAVEIFDKQLEKCGVDYFDYYLLHSINEESYEVAVEQKHFEIMIKRKAEGKIKKIGFSFHSDAELLDKVLSEQPEIEFVQLQLNYIDWENERIQSRKCYETARKHGKEVIIMEPVKGGTLAAIPQSAQNIFKAVEPNMSIASWAIKFAASLDGVITVLSGMSNMEQLQDNISYMEDFEPLTSLQQETIKKVVDDINSSIAIPCTSCKYCIKDCPKEIAIPDFFALYNLKQQELKQDEYIEDAYYEDYVRTRSKASDCIECGKCEAACPQHIDIIKELKVVAKSFESE